MASKPLARAILAWLDAQRASLPADLAEGLEVGTQTIADAFGVTLEDSRASAGLLDAAWAASAHAAPPSPAAPPAAAAAPSSGAPSDFDGMPSLLAPASPEDEAKAEAAKAAGNAALEAGQIGRAEELYTQAISLAPSAKNSHIYFSNRAMARAKLQDAEGSAGAWRAAGRRRTFAAPPPVPPPPTHTPTPSLPSLFPAEDARSAVRLSPGYAKGWSRLGAALISLGQLAEAEAALEKSLALEPGNRLVQDNLADCRRKRGGAAGGGSSVAAAGGGGEGGGAGATGGMGGLAGLMGGGLGAELLPLLADPELAGIFAQVQKEGPGVLMQHMGNPKMAKVIGAVMKNPGAMQALMGLAGGAGGLGGMFGGGGQ